MTKSLNKFFIVINSLTFEWLIGHSLVKLDIFEFILEQKEQKSKSLSRVSIRLVLVVLESKLGLKLSKLIKPANHLALFNLN